jgi:hypothetical protein
MDCLTTDKKNILTTDCGVTNKKREASYYIDGKNCSSKELEALETWAKTRHGFKDERPVLSYQ